MEAGHRSPNPIRRHADQGRNSTNTTSSVPSCADAYPDSSRQHITHDTCIPISELIAITADDARLLADERQWSYDCGYTDGREAGYREAHEEMAAHFALVSRSVRQHAGHPSFAERAAAEGEWARPRAGDFTGRLSPSEYFGTEGARRDA